MEQNLALGRALLDSAESLDVTLARHGDELELRLDYVESVEGGPPGALADLRGLLGFVDPASSALVAFNGTWTESFALFEDYAEAVLQAYPEPLRGDLAKLLDLQRELDPLLAPGLVMGLDFGPGGLHGSYVLRSPRPAELAARLEAMLRVLDHERGLVRVGAAERLVVDGLEARVLPLTLRHEALFAALAGGPAGGLPAEAEARFRQTMEAVYGRELRLALAVRGELVAVCIAGDDVRLRADLARLRAPGAPAPELLRLIERFEPGALGFAYHLDFGQTMTSMLEAMRGVLPGQPPAFPARAVALDFWGCVRGRTWSGGIVMDLAELLDFVRSLRTLDEK
jgi:hypothetical protein